MSSLPEGRTEPDGLLFREVQAALGLFAEAIAGRPVLFASDDTSNANGGAGDGDRASDGGWPFAASAGDRPVLSGPDTVVVPGALDLFESRDDGRRAYRVVILHQVLAQLAQRESIDDRGADASTPSSSRDRGLQNVVRMVEDLRVDAEIRRRFPGATLDLDALLHLAMARCKGGDSLNALRFRSLGATTHQLAERFPNVDPALRGVIVDETAVLLEPHATRSTSVAVARRLHALIATGVFPDRTLAEELADDSSQAVTDEAGGGGVSSAGTPSEFVDADGLSHGQSASDGASAASPEAPDDPPSRGLSVATTAEVADRIPRSFVYDEWDYVQGRHRPGWCRVVEAALVGTDYDFITGVRDRHRQLRAAIRSSFGRLRPTDLVRVYQCDDGAEIDLDAAIQARLDRRSGAPADDRLHIRRDRGARDVATAFLIDLSASTSSPAVEPEPPPLPPNPDPYDDVLSYAPIWAPAPDAEPERRVIDVALDAVALMSDALHELGDRHAIYGFSGTGRLGVEFKVAKDFNDRVSPATWAALAAMKPLRYTRMGPAIRHATTKLRAQTARTRLLIVISDGYPQDIDYGDDPRDREYGVQDTARALDDATRAGIDTFCVTIDPAGHDYLRAMAPENRYLVIDDVEVLPEVLPQLYLTLAAN